MLMRI